MRDLDSNSMICLQVIGFSCLTLITLNLVMFSYREVIPDNPRSLARVGFNAVRGERERAGDLLTRVPNGILIVLQILFTAKYAKCICKTFMEKCIPQCNVLDLKLQTLFDCL